MALDFDKLKDKAISKVKDTAVGKARDTVISSLNKVTGGIINDTLKTINSASGVVVDEGANEASKRFEMYQTHTNRPKNSQQFYVLFHPRDDLIYDNVSIPGQPGQKSQMMADLKAWGKRTLKKTGEFLESLVPEWSGSEKEGEEGKEKGGAPSWMTSIANGAKSVSDTIVKGYNVAKNAVTGTINFAKGVAKDVKDGIKDAKDWFNEQREYVFGTKGTADQIILFQPEEYYPMTSGWLSSFCQTVKPRSAIIEFGLFAEADSITTLRKMCDEISMHCVDTDRPSFEMPVTRYNQYNRDRLVYEKVKYKPVTMTFYDTIDSCLLKLLMFQLAFVSDSYLKEFRHFTEYTQLENFLNNPGNWGQNLYSNIGIFNAISIVEIWGNQCTVYNLQMPKITDVNLSKADASRSDVHKITITFEYEGLTNINPCTLEQGGYDIMLAWAMADSAKAAEICRKCRMKYESSTQMMANFAKDLIMGDGSITDKLKGVAQVAGLGSEVKLAEEVTSAIKTGNIMKLGKQLANPSSVTSKIARIF